MPAEWAPRRQEGATLRGTFWDIEEFHAFVHETDLEGDVEWVEGSYSKTAFLLAMIADSEGDAPRALELVERGLRLEPDHPRLWCEKARHLARQGELRGALEAYRFAAGVRPWDRAGTALALRGVAALQLQLGNVKAARVALLRSEELEPVPLRSTRLLRGRTG